MTKIAWVCDECNWLQVSDSKECHQMNSCKCGDSTVDLEEDYCRFIGAPRVIAELKDGEFWRYKRK